MLTTVVTVEREEDLTVALTQAMARLSNYSALLPRLGTISMDSQKRNIEESRSPDGAPYAPLKHERRTGHPYGDKPLLDTTNMYQSIHFDVRNAAEVFAGPSMDQADYFPYVNEGRPRKGVPPRTFIGIRSDDVNDMEVAVGQWCMTQLSR